MNSMEMSAVIMSPLPKKKAAKKDSKKADAESEKRSKISKVAGKKTTSHDRKVGADKNSSASTKKADKASKKYHLSELKGFQQNDPSQTKDTGSGMLESEIGHGFITSNDAVLSSGDSTSGSAQ